MNREGSRWWPVVVLGAVASLSFWLERSVHVAPTGSALASHAPRFWSETLLIRKYDAAGKLQNVLHADHLTQFADTQELLLTQPRIDFGTSGAVSVTAREAKVSADGKRVDLHGDVKVRRLRADGQGEPIVLATDQLTAYPDLGRANTTRPVVITQGSSRATGTGMTADANTGITQVGGRVRATVSPKGNS